MAVEWVGGNDDRDADEYTLVDTGSQFAYVRRHRPAPPGRGLTCGHLKDDGKVCKRKAPCRLHYPK